jgi:hypothetical protein
MLKIHILAAIIAVVLTALTVLLVPYIYTGYVYLGANYPKAFQWVQVAIGFGIAGLAYWRWKKRKSRKDDQ